MTDMSTSTPQSPAPQPAAPARAQIDPLLGYDPAADPLSPQFQDATYDHREWERLPRRSPFIVRIGIVVLVIVAAFAFLFSRANAWLDAQIDPAGAQGGELVVDIPPGATDSDVMRILAESDVIVNSTVAQYWLRWQDVGGFQAGEYLFRENSSLNEAVEVLRRGPLPPVFLRLTIPEGLWAGDIRNVLLDSPDMKLDPSELAAAMNNSQVRSEYQPAGQRSIEGLMFPATYQISEEESNNALLIVQRLVNQMDAVIREVGAQDGLDLGNGVSLTPYEVLIVASMIEEEARLDVDRPRIARVIYNRLADGEALGIDATTIYGVHLDRCGESSLCQNPSTDFSWYDPALTQSQLDDENDPYNSRIVPGLPPTPISSPGRASLAAAMNPEPGPWKWYVLVNTDGSHFFTDDFNEFLNRSAQAQAEGVF